MNLIPKSIHQAAFDEAQRVSRERQQKTLDNIRINIKDHRIKQRYSQQALADACGLTKQTISNIETGKNQPTAATVIAISNVLGVEEVWGIKAT